MFHKKEKKVILLIDNFQQAREVAKTVLEGTGYTVIAVGNLGDALKAIASKKPDMIISEIELPGMGGVGFYTRLKKNKDFKNVPFVFTTGYDLQKLQPLQKFAQRYRDIILSKPIQWKSALEQIATMFLEHNTKNQTIAPVREKVVAIPAKTLGTGHVKTVQNKNADGRSITASKNRPPNIVGNTPKILEMRDTGPVIIRRKKKTLSPMATPLWHSTKNFTPAMSTLGTKELGKSVITKIFQLLSKGKKIAESPMQISPLNLETTYLKDKIKQQKETSGLFQEDIEMEVEDVEEVLDVSPPIIPLKHNDIATSTIVEMLPSAALSEQDVYIEPMEIPRETSEKLPPDNHIKLVGTEESKFSTQFSKSTGTRMESDHIDKVKDAETQIPPDRIDTIQDISTNTPVTPVQTPSDIPESQQNNIVKSEDTTSSVKTSPIAPPQNIISFPKETLLENKIATPPNLLNGQQDATNQCIPAAKDTPNSIPVEPQKSTVIVTDLPSETTLTLLLSHPMLSNCIARDSVLYQDLNYEQNLGHTNMTNPMSHEKFSDISQAIFVVGTVFLQAFGVTGRAFEIVVELDSGILFWKHDENMETWTMALSSPTKEIKVCQQD